MLTRSGAKRQRADQKAAPQSVKPCSVAQSLSASLLLHLMRFLDDSRSLARIQSVCRNWRALTSNQLDFCWRPLYLRDWEAESATDDCVLPNGDSTAWKHRYEERARLEKNWTAGS